MSWIIAPECVSTVFLCIIWIYSRKGNLIPSLKNKLFHASLLTTFFAMTTNILSTLLIHQLDEPLLLVTWLVTAIYFISTPLLGMIYFLYAMSNIHEDTSILKRYLLLSSIPGALYLLVVIFTPFTGHLFTLSVVNGYTQGPYIWLTYLIFYLYCVVCVFLVILQGQRVPWAIRAILFSLPALAGLVIIFQLIFPRIVLSGSAATCSILIIYLYLQNRQISIDYLTQLPNRHQLLNLLDLYIRKNTPFSLVVLSLRDFKTINDLYGQHSGDQLLSALSSYLRKDLELPEGAIYRYSGDEFALVLPHGSEELLTPLLERIFFRMLDAWDVPGCTCILSPAMGVVNYPDTAEELAGLINGLEYAVTRAKQDGEHNHVCYCTPELLTASKRRHLISEDLEENLKNGGFELHYQPIFAVDTGRFIKAEALLRMPKTQLGRVFPDEFIPVAEESGLIIEITYLVLDKVCAFIRRLLDDGVELESINVNFSALQFSQPNLLPRMLAIMQRHQVPCSKIKIELTESTLIENAEGITDYLRQMNELGIRIGLDDFGTGYSNLLSVLDLPIDTIKLDKSLVWSAVKNPRCSIAVQNFVRAFRELNLTVLAEGVETEEHRRFVVNVGCTLIQGFFYARPMPEAEFVAFLQAHSAPPTTDEALS